MNSVSVDSNKLKSLFGAYYDRRMFRILLLGIISGFPWVLIGSALSLWLKEEGLSRSTIGGNESRGIEEFLRLAVTNEHGPEHNRWRNAQVTSRGVSEARMLAHDSEITDTE